MPPSRTFLSWMGALARRFSTGLIPPAWTKIGVGQLRQDAHVGLPGGAEVADQGRPLALEDGHEPGVGALDRLLEHDVGLVQPGRGPVVGVVADLGRQRGTRRHGATGRGRPGERAGGHDRRHRGGRRGGRAAFFAAVEPPASTAASTPPTTTRSAAAPITYHFVRDEPARWSRSSLRDSTDGGPSPVPPPPPPAVPEASGGPEPAVRRRGARVPARGFRQGSRVWSVRRPASG